MTNTKKDSKGFVLLYAVLVSGIVLGVGLSLIDIVAKQIILSSIARNSQFAYYAADAGKQCAYFWHATLYSPVFGITKDSELHEAKPEDFPQSQLDFLNEIFQDGNNGAPWIKCQGQWFPVTQDFSDPSDVTSRFSFPLTISATNGQSCALVEVRRYIYTDADSTIKTKTVIKSSGYNTSCIGLETTQDTRRIERVVVRLAD